jgi:hypothetical protein
LELQVAPANIALETLYRDAVDHVRGLFPANDPQLAFALAGLVHALLI